MKTWRLIDVRLPLRLYPGGTDRKHRDKAAVLLNIGMYGPPLVCKRNLKMTGWSAPMYSAFGGVSDSWP
jgi:hypothetical protein